jgi:hypothetical protein
MLGYEFNPAKHQLIECIEDECLRSENDRLVTSFVRLPDVFLMPIKFYIYDFEKDQMTMVRNILRPEYTIVEHTDHWKQWPGHFEYPSLLDLAVVSEDHVNDTVYQLHG